MKSKFADVSKVRKQALDFAELALLEARHLEQRLENELEAVYAQMLAVEVPSRGDIALLQQMGATKLVLQRQREEIERQLTAASTRVIQMQEAYKRANLEFEKIKYLEEQEFEQYMKKMKQKEQSDLDEVALQLFSAGEK